MKRMKIQCFDEYFTSNIKQIKTNNIEFIVLTNFSLKKLYFSIHFVKAQLI